MRKHPSAFRQLSRDILELCELQLQLLSVDGQEASRKATRAAIYSGIGVTLGGSALTAALVGGGFVLHEQVGWTVGTSLLAMAAGSLVVVTILLLIASRLIKDAKAAVNETTSEFVENFKWLKAVLIAPESSPRSRFRFEDAPDADRLSVAGSRFDTSTSN